MESWTERFGEVRALLHGPRTVAASQALAAVIEHLSSAHPERADAELLPYARGVLRTQRADRPRVRFAVRSGVAELPGWVVALPELMIPTTTSLQVLTAWGQDEALGAHDFGFMMVGINATGRQGRAYHVMSAHPSMARVVALALRDANLLFDAMEMVWCQQWTQRLEIVDLRGSYLPTPALLRALGARSMLRELCSGNGLGYPTEQGFRPPGEPIRWPELRVFDLSGARPQHPAFYTELLAHLALPRLEVLNLHESDLITAQVIEDMRALLPSGAEVLGARPTSLKA